MTDTERKTVIYLCQAFDSAGYDYEVKVNMPYIPTLGPGPFKVREGRVIR